MPRRTKRILVVTTNEAPLLKGLQLGLFFSEMTQFVEEVTNAGYTVDIATCKGGAVPLDETSTNGSALQDPANVAFMKDARLMKFLKQSLKVSNCKMANYDALYVPGGYGVLYDLPQNTDLQNLIAEFHAAGKVLASVCHGACAFMHVKDKDGNMLLQGQPVSATPNREQWISGTLELVPFKLEDGLTEVGATYEANYLFSNPRVAIGHGGKLITGQNPYAAHLVGEAVVEALTGEKAPEKTAEQAAFWWRYNLFRNVMLNNFGLAGKGKVYLDEE